MLKTYQDLLKATTEGQKREFVREAIHQYKNSADYLYAEKAELYVRWKNPTIMNYQKLLTTMTGMRVPDIYTANHRCASNFFNRFVTQENQYLLANGVTFENDDTKDKLGFDFDTKLQEAGKWALVHAVAYGFWNLDHLEVFKMTEFVPILDEENGSLRSGVRWWQVDTNKPMRATLYEEDGYTEYIVNTRGDFDILKEKRGYIEIVKSSEADGDRIMAYQNYPSFPIVPLWGNPYHQSSLIGLKEQIDAYDLIKSGFANDLDDVNQIYWILENAGGMDDVDIAKFIERLKTIRCAQVDGGEGAHAEAHTIEVPYQSREIYLKRLEEDMYKDAMALNVDVIAGGAVTATQINASYEPLNSKTDEYEYCVISFIQEILKLQGIEDMPTFKRSKIVNQLEETQMVLQASQFLDDKTVLSKLPWLSEDEVDEILERRDDEGFSRFLGVNDGFSTQTDGQNTEPTGEEG